MARISTHGFELNTAAAIEFAFASGYVGSTTTVRSGTYSARVSSLASGTAKISAVDQFSASNNDGPWFCRVYLRVATRPSAANRIIGLQNASNAYIAFIKLNSDGTLQLADEDGDIGSPSEVVPLDYWENRVEIKVDRTPSAGSHLVEAKLNGTVFATSSARNLSTGVRAFTVGGNLASEAQTQGDWFFDDIAVNDSTGSFETGYPGHCSGVVVLRPNGAGDVGDWTGDYTGVDEVTPNDATDLVSAGGAGAVEEWTIEDTPSAIQSAATIKVVHVSARYNRNNNLASPAFVERIKAVTGGTVEESAAVTPAGTGFVTDANNVLHLLTLYDLPGASTTAWTKADLDAAQIGLRLSTGGSGLTVAQVTAAWVTVEYVNPAFVPQIVMTG